MPTLAASKGHTIIIDSLGTSSSKQSQNPYGVRGQVISMTQASAMHVLYVYVI